MSTMGGARQRTKRFQNHASEQPMESDFGSPQPTFAKATETGSLSQTSAVIVPETIQKPHNAAPNQSPCFQEGSGV